MSGDKQVGHTEDLTVGDPMRGLVKVVRFDLNGFHSYNTEKVGLEPYDSSIEGCYAFAGFISEWGLTGVKKDYDTRNTVYLPENTLVWCRNVLVDDLCKEEYGNKEVQELCDQSYGHTWGEQGEVNLLRYGFVLRTLSFVLDRAKRYYKVGPVSTMELNKPHCINHTYLAACEIILPKYLVDEINSDKYQVEKAPYQFTYIPPKNRETILKIYNEVCLPVIEQCKHPLTILYFHRLVRLQQDGSNSIDLKLTSLDKDNKQIKIEVIAIDSDDYTTWEGAKPFHECYSLVKEKLQQIGYEVVDDNAEINIGKYDWFMEE